MGLTIVEIAAAREQVLSCWTSRLAAYLLEIEPATSNGSSRSNARSAPTARGRASASDLERAAARKRQARAVRGAARTVVRVQAARVTSTRVFLYAVKTFATHSLPRLERGGERGADTYGPRRAGRASPAAHASTNNQKVDQAIHHDDHNAEHRLQRLGQAVRVDDRQQITQYEIPLVRSPARHRAQIIFQGRQRARPVHDLDQRTP